jgi:hypothetical protein
MPLCGLKARTVAPTTAYGVEDLFSIVAEGAKKDPSRKAVEAVALFAVFMLLVGRGVLRALR